MPLTRIDGDDGGDDDGGQVEERAGRGRTARRPGRSRRARWSSALGSVEPEDADEVLEVVRPAVGHRGRGHGVLEDQVPADDPGEQLAQGGVGVGVGGAGDRHHRGELGVAQRGEDAGRGRRRTKESISAGPALSWAAMPVSTKMPVPMMAPMPRLVSCTGPSTRRRRFSPFISSSSSSSGFLAKSGLPMRAPGWLLRGVRTAVRRCGPRPDPRHVRSALPWRASRPYARAPEAVNDSVTVSGAGPALPGGVCATRPRCACRPRSPSGRRPGSRTPARTRARS